MKIDKYNYIKYILEDVLVPWTRTHITIRPFCSQQVSQRQGDAKVVREEFEGLHLEQAVTVLLV